MSIHRQYVLAGLVAVTYVLALLACTLPGLGTVGGKPTVNIIAPAAGTQVRIGETVTVQALTVDSLGIARVELWVYDTLVGTQSLPQPVSTYQAALTWVADSPGSQVLLVRAYNTVGVASDPAAVKVTVVPDGSPTPPPTPTPGTVTPTPATPTPTPATVRIAPDGTGDYPSLETAVDAVPPGSTLILKPGTYHLTAPLVITKSLRLAGAGIDQTVLIGDSGEYVARFAGPGSFSAEGVAFRYEGTDWARVVVVEDGEVNLVRCSFSGGLWDEAEDKGGSGLVLLGNTAGYVRECRVEGNGLHGIELHGQAQPTLEANVCTGNAYSGIVYFDDAGGVARQNECSGNKYHGISIQKQARPTLEENTCQQNESTGIVYFDDASGTAYKNKCSDNGLHGISVNDRAQPALEENVCAANKDSGIVYFGDAGGLARQNECYENKWGIYISATANPSLVDNDCHDNKEADVRDFRAAETPVATTTPATPTPSPPTTPRPTSPAPALTGKIAFPVLNRDKRHYDVWIVNADGSNLRRVAERVRQPCFRSDGGMLAVNGEAPNQANIVIMSVDGANSWEASGHAEDSHPSWSPDGTRLVYDTTTTSGSWQIGIVDDTIKRLWHIVPGPGVGVLGLLGKYPTWMPDGRIIFSTADYWAAHTQGGLYIIEDGGGATPLRVTSSGEDTAPDVHASTVAFMSIRKPGNYEIYSASIYGLDAKLRQLTDNDVQDGLPTWSPDGRHIAFVSNQGDTWSLWVMNADGTGRRKLIDLPGTLGEDWATERISWVP